MNNQEFKEMVIQGINKLEAQGEFSITPNGGGCLYSKDSDSVCCIVGHMMPSREIRVRADSSANGSIRSLYEDGFGWVQQFSAHQIDVLSTLQIIHDSKVDTSDTTIEEAVSRMREFMEESYENNTSR